MKSNAITQNFKAWHHLAPKTPMLLLLMRAVVAVVVETFKALVAVTVKSLSVRTAVEVSSRKMSYSPLAGP